ncbi:MAG: Rid family hydrolase [Planctomycetota bacterium]
MPKGPGDFSGQLRECESAYQDALDKLGLNKTTAVMRRFFLSDAANQEVALSSSPLARRDPGDPVCISIVEQPPLPEGRVALWAYHLSDPDGTLRKEQRDGGLLVPRASGSHLWTSELPGTEAMFRVDAGAQTRAAFESYQEALRRHGARLRDHVIRTWIFVQSIDLDYGAMTRERRQLFEEEGMTPETHYIASTGIAGRRADPRRTVILEGYAVPGIQAGQIRPLEAPARLGPSHAYGVTFERGVRVDHGDRLHIFISGTASIDNGGRVCHPRDIASQTERTFENIAGLLDAAGSSFADLAQMIVYLRDPGDRASVASWLEERFPETPLLLVHAPVCRPEWLIEVECQAVAPGGDPVWGRL